MEVQIRPIKVKKKHKMCPNCANFTGYNCKLAPGEVIPAKIFNYGCKKYEQNKHIYF